MHFDYDMAFARAGECSDKFKGCLSSDCRLRVLCFVGGATTGAAGVPASEHAGRSSSGVDQLGERSRRNRGADRKGQCGRRAKANARAASMSTRTLTQAEASRDARKKANEFGFRAEVYNGNTLFCKHDAAIGSRIPLVRCMSAQEFDEYATQMKIARDSLENNLETQCQGKFNCGGMKMGQTGNASN